MINSEPATSILYYCTPARQALMFRSRGRAAVPRDPVSTALGEADPSPARSAGAPWRGEQPLRKRAHRDVIHKHPATTHKIKVTGENHKVEREQKLYLN